MSRRPVRKGKPSRRKAGRRPAPKAKRKHSFRLTIEGQEMLVSYKPDYFGGEFAQGHFEFRSPHKPPRRIVVSETGYLSHFAPMAEVGSCGGPETFVREFVDAILNRTRKIKLGKQNNDQLSLF
jgi:hypothetical protein